MIGYKNATLFILVMIEKFSIITRINKVAFLHPITTVCKKVWSTVYTMNITNIPPRRKLVLA